MLDPVGVEGMERQRQQARLFFGESFGHGACAIVGPAPLVRHFIAPHQRLAIAFRQGGEDAAGPEGIAYIPNGSFHAAFLISRAHLARTWREVIVSRQFQQPRVEMNLIAAAFQHGAFEIVVILWRIALCGHWRASPRTNGLGADLPAHNGWASAHHGFPFGISERRLSCSRAISSSRQRSTASEEVG